MKKLVIFLALCFPAAAFAQSNKSPGGEFSLGVRSTVSLFNDGGSGTGTGFGGQFRLRFYEFLNSEWFADYITSGIGSIGTRTDYHIGWSVMFYFTQLNPGNSNTEHFKPFRLRPYFLTGHCFDYTRFRSNSPYPDYNLHGDAHRWSSAIQAGLGCHIPFTPKLDLSVNAQYMLHLGKEIIMEERIGPNDANYLYTAVQDASGLEGHLLVSFTLNYRIADLWHDKKGALGNGPHVQPDAQ